MHDDLLQQARNLALLDARKPKQANLRRAISAAYYSLFHYLVDQSCRLVLGTRHDQAPYRQVLGRAFEHTTMKEACRSFAGGTLKAGASKGLPPSFVVPPENVDIAALFFELQTKRHQADYDLTERFRRKDVLGLIGDVDIAIRRFQRIPSTNEKKFFLACLWAWRTLSKR